MNVTPEMLQAAVSKAVETGLIPKYACGEESYLKSWNSIKSVLEAALNKA